MPNPDDIRRSEIPTFEPHTRPNSRDFNMLGDAIRRNTAGLNSIRQSSPLIAQTLPIQLIITNNADGDFITCATWDGSNQGTEDILVAKPYLLQQSTLDGQTDTNGIAYVFTGIDALTATQSSTSTVENWEVTMDYNVGDLIYAIGNIEGGIDDADSDGNQLQWIDLNIDGRGWAKV